MLRNELEPTHLLVVLAVVLLIFGGKKLPELARGAGQGLRIFRAELRGGRNITSHDDASAGELTSHDRTA